MWRGQHFAPLVLFGIRSRLGNLRSLPVATITLVAANCERLAQRISERYDGRRQEANWTDGSTVAGGGCFKTS